MHDVSGYVGSSANCTLLFDDDEANRAAVAAAGYNVQVVPRSSATLQRCATTRCNHSTARCNACGMLHRSRAMAAIAAVMQYR